MKLLRYIYLAVLGVVLFTACTANFEEINQDIDNPTSIPSDQMTGNIIRGMANTMYSTFNGGEAGMTWAQHEAMIQYNDPERYKPRQTTTDGVWNSFYGFASNADQMYKLAEAEGNKLNQGVAKVLKAYAFHILTDLYGDIPYTEALTGGSSGNFKPVYDSQQVVYEGILTELDEALTLLSSGQGSIDSSLDILYSGDVTKWKKFATSLKFRALMRISGKVNPGSELQKLVNSGLLFSSNDDEAKLIFLPASPNANPMYETIVEQSREEHKLCNTFVDFLINNNDGRLYSYAQEAENGGYVGKPAGFSAVPVAGYDYKDVSSIGERYLAAQAPAYFVSYSQLLFLMAEAAKKGYISGGDTSAEMYYLEAIANSFNENEATGYSSYITQSAIAYKPSQALQQIATQEWVVLFSQGFEAWTEWRRTGYPALTPAIDAYTTSIPSRYVYNADESSLNAVNYQAAIANQGADELTTKIWWMN